MWKLRVTVGTLILCAAIAGCQSAMQGDDDQPLPDGPRESLQQQAEVELSPSPLQVEATASPIESSATSDRFELVPFDYMLLSVGDGWNEGQVRIAFQNSSHTPLPIEELQLSSPVILTAEGPTYPGELLHVKGGMGLGGSQVARQEIKLYDLRMIPPGFRFTRDATDAPDISYVIKWRSSESATPQRITFPGREEFDFDLPSDQQRSLTFPFDAPPANIETFASLQGYKLIDVADEVVATLTGRCVVDTFFRPDATYLTDLSYYLEFSAENRDQFYEHSHSIQFPISLFNSNGSFVQRFETLIEVNLDDGHLEDELTLGPGQLAAGYLFLGQATEDTVDLDPIVVTWLPAGSYRVFDTLPCSSSP